MRVITSTSTTETSQTVHVQKYDQDSAKAVQVNISVAATVTLQGRADPTGEWHTIATFASSDMINAASLPSQVRADITGNTGTVTVDLDITEVRGIQS